MEKPNFQEFWVKMANLKVKVNDPHFQYQPRISQDECLVQMWQFQPKLMSYYADMPNFLEFWVKMAKVTLKVKVNDSHFQYQLRISQDVCLVQIWQFQLKSMTSYHADKPNFLEFLVKMVKITLKIKVNNPHFQYQLRVSHDACLVQICRWWLKLKSVTFIKGTRLSRWTDTSKDNTPSAWNDKG